VVFAAVAAPMAAQVPLDAFFPLLTRRPVIGDVELESKVILFASADRRALVTAGLALTLPTGSERRGLGGESVIEPFAAVGLVAADLLIVSDVGYAMMVAGPARDQRRIPRGARRRPPHGALPHPAPRAHGGEHARERRRP
jgi:hypothetical protein